MHCVCSAWFVPVELLSVGWRGYFFFYWNSEYETLRPNDTNTIDKYKPSEDSWLTDPKLWQEYYWFRFISSSSTIYSLCLWPTYSDLMKSLNYHHQFNKYVWNAIKWLSKRKTGNCIRFHFHNWDSINLSTLSFQSIHIQHTGIIIKEQVNLWHFMLELII